MPTGLTWQNPPERAWSELAARYARAVENMVYAVAKRWAPRIEEWMKVNAPWTDRTGNARQGLYTEVNRVAGSMVQIILAHGVEYGLWLEISNASRFGIVNPALDHFGPLIWQDIVRELS